jgi:hypothetical protein
MRRASLGWIVRIALGVAVLGTIVATSQVAVAQADPRGQARDHFLAGKRLYDAGSYQQAIAEFTQADQLAPSGINDFNIALCDDKLGNPADASAHYKSYLVRVPDAGNRAQVEQTIARLDAAVAAAAQQKAAADAATAAQQQKLADEAAAQKAAADAALAAQQQAAAAAAAQQAATTGPATTGPATAGPATTVRPVTPPTGDPDLDRVAAIDVNAIRDQRGGGAATSAGGASATNPVTPAAGTAAPTNANGPTAPSPEAPKAKPVYKKWWFWAMIVVGGVVLVNLMSSTPSNAQPGTRALLAPPAAPSDTGPGFAVFHF